MNKTVLVTGGSRGIGKELCIQFANKGYHVAINYNNSKNEALKLSEELNSKGFHTIAIKADVSSEQEVQHMVKEAIDRFGFIDCLINNAGVSKSGVLHSFNTEDYDRIFDTNMKGLFLVTKEILPYMIRKQRGSILNISSIWGICGASTEVLYSASKAAMIGFTKALAKEVGPSHINVNCIAPGVIDTEMNSNLSEEELDFLKEETPLGKIGTTQDISSVAFFLASDEASFITGQVISPNGGLVI